MVSGFPVTSWHPSRPAQDAPAAARSGGTRAFALEASRARDLELSITTVEGDKVTISMHAEVDRLLAGYRGLAPGRGVGGALAATSVERTTDVTVQGSLSEQERADIAALAARVADAARSFYRQHLDTASRMLSQFGDLGSIQSFTAEASQQSSVTLVSVGGLQRPLALPGPVAPATDDGSSPAIAAVRPEASPIPAQAVARDD